MSITLQSLAASTPTTSNSNGKAKGVAPWCQGWDKTRIVNHLLAMHILASQGYAPAKHLLDGAKFNTLMGEALGVVVADDAKQSDLPWQALTAYRAYWRGWLTGKGKSQGPATVSAKGDVKAKTGITSLFDDMAKALGLADGLALCKTIVADTTLASILMPLPYDEALALAATRAKGKALEAFKAMAKAKLVKLAKDSGIDPKGLTTVEALAQALADKGISPDA